MPSYTHKMLTALYKILLALKTNDYSATMVLFAVKALSTEYCDIVLSFTVQTHWSTNEFHYHKYHMNIPKFYQILILCMQYTSVSAYTELRSQVCMCIKCLKHTSQSHYEQPERKVDASTAK